MALSAQRQDLQIDSYRQNLAKQIRLLEDQMLNAVSHSYGIAMQIEYLKKTRGAESEIIQFYEIQDCLYVEECARKELHEFKQWLYTEDKQTEKFISVNKFFDDAILGKKPEWMAITSPELVNTRQLCYMRIMTLELRLTNELIKSGEISDLIENFSALNANFNNAMTVFARLDKPFKTSREAAKLFYDQCKSEVFTSVDAFLAVAIDDPRGLMLTKIQFASQKSQIVATVLEKMLVGFQSVDAYINAKGYSAGMFGKTSVDISALRIAWNEFKSSLEPKKQEASCIVM